MSTTAGGTIEVFLAIDNSTVPAKLLPNGSLSPLYKGDLVWVVHVSRITLNYNELDEQGGAAQTSKTTLAHPPCVYWDETTLVNANTGAKLNGEAQGTYD
jgi:hypothetical protein